MSTFGSMGGRAGRLERGQLTARLGPILVPVARAHRATLARRVRIVAVVGSVGKTTTMRAISAVLGLKVQRSALLNTNSKLGLARGMLSMKPSQRRAVFEIGISHPGHMRSYAGLVRPDVTVVTAIRSDHWQSLPTLEVTRDEKAHALRLLRPGGVAILNADDPNVRWMATQAPGRVMFIGESEDAEVRAVDITLDWPHGMRFVALVDGERHEVRTRLVGRHMVFPALAALAVAHLEGMPLEPAIAAIGGLEPTSGRMAPKMLANGAHVISDDFKASHESFEKALETLAELPARRRIAVFGLLTEPRGTDSYREIGRRAGAVVDRLVVVGSSKDLRAYRAGAAASGLAAQNVDHVRNAHEAVELLRDQLGPDDVVLVKGRWQQRLARVGLELAGRDVQCRVDPCPIKRMVCEMCPMLNQPFTNVR